MVVLTNEASVTLYNYGLSDFSEINCASVSNLTQAATNLVQAELRGADPATLYSVSSDTVTFDNFFNIDENTFNQVLCIDLEETGKDKVLETMEALMKRDDVLYAGPDYPISIFSTEADDTYYEEQWAVDKIQLPQAWGITTGSMSVVVGVLDTGIDASHPDLTKRVNTTLSREFHTGTTVTPTSITDPHGHGTHVAGIIGAQGNNTAGITGTTWKCNLVSLRVFDEDASGFSSNLADAINYATEKGIPILNFSGGWRKSENSNYDYALENVISAYSGIFICAAGNSGFNLDDVVNGELYYDVYPAILDLPNVITVGASTSSDAKWTYSNFGATKVDLFAPGVDILSCYPTANCTGLLHPLGSEHHADGYHIQSGTSMAAPYVAGVAALILGKHPTASTAIIRQWIMNGVDSVSSLDAYCVSGGRLNAYKAVNNHLYTYSSISALKHTCSCVCGSTSTENHTWTTVSTVDNLTNATYRTCTKCGYTVTVSTLADAKEVH